MRVTCSIRARQATQAQQRKFILAALVTILLLAGFSQQAITWTFKASQVVPPDANSSYLFVSDNQITTNLISWDSGATLNPIYAVQQAGRSISIYNEANKKFATQSLLGNSAYHMLDPTLQQVLLDMQTGDHGPSIYSLTYNPATATGALNKKVAYLASSFSKFIGFPVWLPTTSYYYGFYNTGTQNLIVRIDGSVSTPLLSQSHNYARTTGEDNFLIITTSPAQLCNLLLGWVATTNLATNNVKATYYTKPDIDGAIAYAQFSVPGQLSILKAPSMNFAILDNLDETKLFYSDRYSNNLLLFSDVFSATVTTLPNTFSTTVPLSTGSSDILTVANMGPFKMVVGIAQSQTVAWQASVYSKDNLSLMAGGLSIQADANSPQPTNGMVYRAFIQSGGDATLPLGTMASSRQNQVVHLIGNITFKMCTDGKYLSTKDSQCYALGTFPALMGNSSETGSVNLTLSSCSDTNCKSCTALYTACSLCNTGYYLSGTTCSPCGTYCEACTSATSCSACSTGATLTGESCIKPGDVVNNTTGGTTNNSTSGGSGNTTGKSSPSNSSRTGSNSKALSYGIGIGIAVGIGLPLILGGVIVLLTKFGLFKVCIRTP